LYQSLLQDSRFFDLLLRLDEDLAAAARRAGCSCGGVLHSAHYPRKPRGGPSVLGAEHAVRFSFCCALEGCRRRATPVSLRFLGRKVFFGVVVLLVAALRDGPTPKRLERVLQIFPVNVRTVKRWCRFWRVAFVASRAWRAVQGIVPTPIRTQEMPAALLEAFSGVADMEQRVVAVLRVVAPIGAESVSVF
jgi:hypothetical protein